MPSFPVPVYLDCAATAPVDPRVRAEVLRHLELDYGNAGSRTHDFGRRARSAVEQARHLVANVVGALRGDVIFTSGATESNNLAVLGLAAAPVASERRHIVSTAIEHHAVLEPLRALEQRGFAVTLIAPAANGQVDAGAVRDAVRDDTLLVSIIHVNNETGVVQPVRAIADSLAGQAAYLHVDAAQGYGKVLDDLRHPRIDLLSVSGHKIGAPQGIGALIARRRDDAPYKIPKAAQGKRAPLAPLMYGGGQERGLRPGTLPVALIAGFGRAADLALAEHADRIARCRELRQQIWQGLAKAGAVINGDPDLAVPHILNVTIPGLDAETVIAAWSDLVAISQGAACTSAHYTCSHVLGAMRLPAERMDGAIRLSWQHDTPLPPIDLMVAALDRARSGGRDFSPAMTG